MGEALIRGLVEKKLFVPARILVCEADSQRAQYLKKKYRIGIGDVHTVVVQSSAVVLAVKPQDMENVLSQIKGHAPLFISIAAGLTTRFFEKRLGPKTRVVRAMPNMPALIGEGITGYCAGRFVNEADRAKAGLILKALGQGHGCVILFEESQMDAVTAVSGSGPAYVFLFVQQWIAAAIALGLREDVAKRLVVETLIGSVHLLDRTGFSAGDLRSRVTSKGGTTEAAMKVFFKNDIFSKLMKSALSAAKKRAKELAK